MTDIQPFIKEGNVEPVPGKPQYVRTNFIFTCPECGYQAHSNSYTHYGNFEASCREHLESHEE
jgi:hypothetical protein